MKQPFISVIVPVYNVERYLPRCLESLIAQTFTEIEIICVIDGSPDNSLEICKEYGNNDPRIIIITQENQGVAATRNTGLAHANGEYIQFCDPDDFYSKDMCEKLYNVISMSNADLAIAGIQVIYDQNHDISSDKEYYRIKGRGLTAVNEVVFRNADFSLCNKIFKKSIIDAYNINFPVGLYYEDACFCTKYLFVSRTIYYLPEYLYTYIRNDNSIMSNTFKKTPEALDHVKILEDIKCFMSKNNLNGSYETDVFLWMVVNYMRLTIIWGTDSVYDSGVKTASHLLVDIEDSIIHSCPYTLKNDVEKLLALKKNNKQLFLKMLEDEEKQKRQKGKYLCLFPPGSMRRKIIKRLYNFIRHGN